jgi:hypothetical protein
VEELKLRRRPQSWRLACQALVQESLVVLTRPQVGLADREAALARALQEPLPPGPTAWPAPPASEAEAEIGEEGMAAASATSDEADASEPGHG